MLGHPEIRGHPRIEFMAEFVHRGQFAADNEAVGRVLQTLEGFTLTKPTRMKNRPHPLDVFKARFNVAWGSRLIKSLSWISFMDPKT